MSAPAPKTGALVAKALGAAVVTALADVAASKGPTVHLVVRALVTLLGVLGALKSFAVSSTPHNAYLYVNIVLVGLFFGLQRAKIA